MNLEIEKKFLVDNLKWEQYVSENNIELTKDNLIVQGYILKEDNKELRARVYGDIGFLTIKVRDNKIKAKEFEYEIPLKDASNLLQISDSTVVKLRYIIPLYDNLKLEVDVYKQDNEGLITAEIEIPNENYKIDFNKLPDFIVKELKESKYSNYNLSKNPFKLWK